MLMTPMTPNVIASPTATSTSTDPTLSPKNSVSTAPYTARNRSIARRQCEPDFDFLLHAGVGLDLRSHTQLRNSLRVERLQHRLDGGEPNGRIGARQTESRDERSQTRPQAVVGADLREIAARRRP